jgi:hypothetical protein
MITPGERERFEVPDFGLNELEQTGSQIVISSEQRLEDTTLACLLPSPRLGRGDRG